MPGWAETTGPTGKDPWSNCGFWWLRCCRRWRYVWGVWVVIRDAAFCSASVSLSFPQRKQKYRFIIIKQKRYNVRRRYGDVIAWPWYKVSVLSVRNASSVYETFQKKSKGTRAGRAQLRTGRWARVMMCGVVLCPAASLTDVHVKAGNSELMPLMLTRLMCFHPSLIHTRNGCNLCKHEVSFLLCRCALQFSWWFDCWMNKPHQMLYKYCWYNDIF